MASKAKEHENEDFHTKLNSALLLDIYTKMNTVKKMIKALEKEVIKPKIPITKMNERLAFYTEANVYLQFRAMKSMKTAKKFMKWKNEQDMLKEPYLYKTYDELRPIIYDHYLNRRTIPNKNVVPPSDKQRVKDFIKAEDILAAHLKAGGFTWLPLPGTEYSIIIEKPQQFNKRMNYLQTIMKFREQGRPIVYIEQKNFGISGPTLQEVIYATSHPTIYYNIAASRNGYLTSRHDSHSFVTQEHRFLDMFIKDNVVPIVPANTVIVIADKPNHVSLKTPNEHSSRSELIDWLNKSNIPHDCNAHRAELYALVEKSKIKKVDRYNLDKLLKGCGYDVVRRPTDTKLTNFFKNFWDIKNAAQRSKKSLLVDVGGLNTSDDWKRFEDDLIEREKKIYEEDMMMEEIIDRLMIMAKDGQVSIRDTGFDLDTDKPVDQFFSSILIT